MYRINRGLLEWSLDINTFIPEFLKRCQNFSVDPCEVKFYSQQDEDKYIIQYLLKDKITDGTYLEIGACNGLLYSNTKTLEDHFGFKGILIEPQKHFFDDLEKNRSIEKNEFYNCAVSNSEDETIIFTGNNAEGRVLETLSINFIDELSNSYSVPNRKMRDILRDSSFNYIDFMIIDVEGTELSLLQTIDFNYPIFCIIIEALSGQQEKNRIFGEYLKDHGFAFKERQRGNEVWINHNYFRKDLFNI